jgi:hypothetical protein
MELFRTTVRERFHDIPEMAHSLHVELIDAHLLFPPKNLPEARELFHSMYGPYSQDVFIKKVQDVYEEFREAENMTNRLRGFIRKMWLFKRLYDLFDNSMELIKIRMTSLIPNIFAKAIKVLSDIDANIDGYRDTRTKKYANIAIESIRRVYQKVVEIISTDTKFLRLLSPHILEQFVNEASPYMVSKIRCLPWIDPGIALVVTPKHFYFWKDFWTKFFMRNFNNENFCLNDDLCALIADFMPMDIRGETFWDFFEGFFTVGKINHLPKSFRVETVTTRRDGRPIEEIKVVLTLSYFDKFRF